jgi:hypothetical protein
MTDASTTDLITWLRAQLDEDELGAQAAAAFKAGASWTAHRYQEIPGVAVAHSGSQAEHIARHDPARVLAEVDAKRRIIERHTPHEMGNCRNCEAPHWGVKVCNHCYGQAWPCPDVLDVVVPHADRPGYRPEWRP